MRFEFEALGDKLISRDLLRLGDRAVDAAPAFEEIADQFRGSEKRRFSTRGNGTWDDITDRTKARKAASRDPKIRANAARVLIATGDLEDSLTNESSPDHLSIVQPQSLVFGTLDPKAAFHQQGQGVPVRKPLGFTENAKREAIRTLQRWVMTGKTK